MKTKLDIDFLKNISSKVHSEIRPLIGTPKASEIVGDGAGGDKTRYIDYLAEKIIFDTLEENSVACTAISEEAGIKYIGDLKEASPPYLIIDSIDGTNNALRGIPLFALSLAVAGDTTLSTVHTALVMDLYHGFSFWALKGRGSESDSGKITTSGTTSLSEAVIGIDLNALINENILKKLSKLILSSHHIRHLGTTAIENCYVASGKIDAFIELRNKLRITDMAAAYLILKEAGGLMVTEEGEDLDSPITSPTQRVSFVSSGNQKLLDQIIDLLK
ncbi:MAG: inositol monophosphatase family protein [Candidatus Bathyarchaeota archaeon]